MTTRIEERTLPPEHVWIRDLGDGLDHALPWRAVLEAYNHRRQRCRAVCGHQLLDTRAEPAHRDWCTECAAEVTPPRRWWRR